MLKEFSLEGKTAIVTGAGRGLGQGIALCLAEAGADVVAAARTSSEIEETAQQVRKLGRRALAIPTDITKADEVEKMVQQTLREFGQIDILVNNAGANLRKALVPTPELQAFPSDKPVTEEEWHTALDSNLTSMFLCCRAVAPHMIARRQGKIINLFTRSLAQEWARYNINVNAIAPGLVRTQMIEGYFQDPERLARMVRPIPMRRMGTRREVGLLAVYLASQASSYITGQVLIIDGGALA